MSAITYLHVRGTLQENMVYKPRPGRESARPRPRGEGNPDFQLVLLDSGGRVLISVAPQVGPRGCGTDGHPRRFGVRGLLPLHPDGVAYELRHGPVLLHRAEIAVAPRLSNVTCRRTGDKLALGWEHAGDDAGISYNVVARTESGRRVTLARGLTGRSYELDERVIPIAAVVRILVEASDGVRSAEVEAATIEMEKRPPTAHIVAPKDGLILPFGLPLSAFGYCFDAAGEPCSPEGAAWLLDGEQFAAGTLTAVVERPRPGRHTLTLAYTAHDVRVEASTTLVVDEPDDDFRQWALLVGEKTDEIGEMNPGNPL